MALAAFSCFLASAAASVDALAAAFSAGVCFPDPDPEPEPESEPVRARTRSGGLDLSVGIGEALVCGGSARLRAGRSAGTGDENDAHHQNHHDADGAGRRRPRLLAGQGASPTSHNNHCLSACAQLFIELPLYGDIGIRQIGPMTRTRPLRW